MEIAPGVHQVEGTGPWANVFVVAGENGLSVVDSGMPGYAAAIVRYVEKRGYTAHDVTHILVTHGDIDHVGSLAALKERTGAQVVAHRAEVDIVAGRARRQPQQRWLRPLFRVVNRYRPVRVDRAVEDGDTVGGWRVIHAPGHSPGSVCYYDPDRRLILVGDVLMNLPRLRRPLAPFTVDPAESVRSIRRIARLDFEVCGFGHGPPLRERASEIVRRFAERLQGE